MLKRIQWKYISALWPIQTRRLSSLISLVLVIPCKFSYVTLSSVSFPISPERKRRVSSRAPPRSDAAAPPTPASHSRPASLRQTLPHINGKAEHAVTAGRTRSSARFGTHSTDPPPSRASPPPVPTHSKGPESTTRTARAQNSQASPSVSKETESPNNADSGGRESRRKLRTPVKHTPGLWFIILSSVQLKRYSNCTARW